MEEALATVQSMSPAEGWEYLVNRICERESDIDVGMTAGNIRELIEAAATFARISQGGLGPVFLSDLEEAFQQKFGYAPDERAFVLLQRLPVLGAANPIDGSRHFIDVTLSDYLKGGDVAEYIKNPYTYQFVTDARKWFESLSPEAIAFLTHRLGDLDDGVLQEAAMAAHQHDLMVLVVDIFLCITARGHSWSRSQMVVPDVMISHWELDGGMNWNEVIFRECTIRSIDAESRDGMEHWPRFEKCVVGVCWGVGSTDELPVGKFSETEIDQFEASAITTTSILSLNLSTPVRVGLSILKKVYMQAGGGRKDSAMYRGLDHSEMRFVPDALELLRRENLILRTRQRGSVVWVPFRDRAQLVRELVQSPTEEKRLVRELNNLA